MKFFKSLNWKILKKNLNIFYFSFLLDCIFFIFPFNLWINYVLLFGVLESALIRSYTDYSGVSFENFKLNLINFIEFIYLIFI